MSTALKSAVLALAGTMTLSALAQKETKEEHWRKSKPLADAARIVVTVEKGFNGKPIQNAAVIFQETYQGRNGGSMEVKTDPDGRATIDVIEIGSHVTVQVIANGFATTAREMDVDAANKELLIKMERPRAQVSTYVDNSDKPSQEKPGVQEHVVPKKSGAAGATGTTGATR